MVIDDGVNDGLAVADVGVAISRGGADLAMETTVVCQVAIGQVKEQVDRELGSGVRYKVVAGGGTLVEAADQIEADRFPALVRWGTDQATGPGQL